MKRINSKNVPDFGPEVGAGPRLLGPEAETGPRDLKPPGLGRLTGAG
jgi:hypothetical protein